MTASLDHVISRRLCEPTPWEWQQYGSARGDAKRDWTAILDRAPGFRWNEATLQCLDSEARRQEYTRKQWAMPAPAVCGGGPRPNVFRALFIDGGTSATRDSWFDASRYAYNGTKVTDFLDYIEVAHTLTQSTDGQRVAIPTADAAMANARSAAFVSTNANRYLSSRVAADWKYMHDGTGVEILFTCTRTQNTGVNTFYTTRDTTGTGITHRSGTGGVYGLFITGGPNVASGTQFTLNTPCYSDIFYKENDSPEWTALFKTTSVSTGSATPSASDPTTGLLLGAHTTGGSFAGDFNWRSLYSFRRVLTGVQRTIVRQWIQFDTGVV